MHSDTAPPIFIPNHEQGKKWSVDEWDGSDFAYCHRYVPDPTDIALAKAGRFTLHECKNRQPFGDRWHNWCFRCPAGFLFSQQHEYDRELSRDRVMFT